MSELQKDLKRAARVFIILALVECVGFSFVWAIADAIHGEPNRLIILSLFVFGVPLILAAVFLAMFAVFLVFDFLTGGELP